jgi:uncharacterized protein (DUF2336 family)
LLSRVTDLFFVTADQQSVHDREAFGEVMIRMAYAADPITRTLLAERISTAESAPIELIRRLAQDEIFIARPILQYSPCLREGDLVTITSKVEQDHLRATAHRLRLTKPVTDIIVRRGNLSVLLVVTGNTGAEFSPEGLVQLSRAAELHEELQQMLNLRRNLGPSAITRLKRLTEGVFWQQMAESILMTSEELEESNVIMPKKPDVAKKIETPEPKDDQAGKPQMAGRIKAVTPATERALVVSARNGAVEATITAFAKVSQLDKAMVEHCLFQAHISALMVLCKAHSIAPGTFTALLQLRESISGEPTSDTIGLMRRYEGMTSETAQRIISFSDKRPEAAKAASSQNTK